jgi:hypothetical protein
MNGRFEQAGLWCRLDTPGHDACVVLRSSKGWRLSGTAVFSLDNSPCQLSYEVDCDADWHTRTAQVHGWLGGDVVKVAIAAVPGRRWRLNGAEQPLAAGCIDVDLGFTPATNLILIRRVELRIGQAADAPAAWLPFPDLRLERLEQEYCRDGPEHYHYRASGVGYEAVLSVNNGGLVVDYPRLWKLISSRP